MHRRQFMVAVPLLGPLFSFAQGNKEKSTIRIDGVWELDVSYKDSTIPKFVIFKQMGDALRVRDLETGQDYTGTISTSGIWFPLFIKVGAHERAMQATFVGSMKTGTLEGRTQLEGMHHIWLANKLTQLWLCSNHNPKHTAKSQQDMTKFTQENKCEGWHSARQLIPSG